MAWFKVDDGFYSSHKVLQIPREYRNDAIGAWLVVATWSADKMTDGIVPRYILDDFNVSEDALQWLLNVGLWIDDEDGIKYHDWCEYQPTREQLEAKRADQHTKKVAAGKKGAAKRWHGDSTGIADDSKAIANDSPEPEPEPEPEPQKDIAATFLPADWKPTDEHKQKAKENNLDLEREAERFRLHADTHGRKAKRWNSAFSMWLSKATPTPSSQPDPDAWMNNQSRIRPERMELDS
jgi:hypothetical protein